MFAKRSFESRIPKQSMGTSPRGLGTSVLRSGTRSYHMGRSRYGIFETEYPYFMTCTVVGLLPVFTRKAAVEDIYESWRFLQREREFQLFGYVILENHLHLIAKAPDL